MASALHILHEAELSGDVPISWDDTPCVNLGNPPEYEDLLRPPERISEVSTLLFELAEWVKRGDLYLSYPAHIARGMFNDMQHPIHGTPVSYEDHEEEIREEISTQQSLNDRLAAAELDDSILNLGCIRDEVRSLTAFGNSKNVRCRFARPCRARSDVPGSHGFASSHRWLGIETPVAS